ncbi:hypothetical protein DMN91_005549 [Ooceraea biroi]|uniref:Odorant receptor n=3 Tax=Ooceraea biroi TaxID=2015173 RepID=A0A3L8DLH4_OOCBI|nr:hypothetical protein DMN91_005549 [Ooceraea biroi]
MTVYIVLQHFNLNRILLLIVGLWPFQRSKLIQLQLMLFSGILTTFVVFQFTTFLKFECTTDFVLNILSSSCLFSCGLIEYSAFWINNDIIKHAIKKLQHMCNELQNENEIAIIKKYGDRAKSLTKIFTMFAMCCIFSAIFLQIWTHLYYTDMSINTSRSLRTMYIMTEYFIDREKYCYFIMLYEYAAYCIAGFAAVGTGTMLLAILQHMCGMFSIVSFRIEQAVTTNMLSDLNQQNQTIICKKIVDAIDIHRKTMEFCNFLTSNFEGSFFFLILVGMICLASSLVRVVSSISDMKQIVIPVISISICYVYLFISNYAAQEVMDHNNRIFDTAYNVQWYAASVRIQKMILFLLQRGSKAFNLNLGGLFIGSVESAAMLMSTSISYFTFLYSTRQD